MKHAWSPVEMWSKGLLILIGSTIVAGLFFVASGSVLTRLGVEPSVAAAVGTLLWLPVWAAVACGALLATRVRGAFTATAALTIAFAAALAAAALR
jgi:hypothetical protein